MLTKYISTGFVKPGYLKQYEPNRRSVKLVYRPKETLIRMTD